MQILEYKLHASANGMLCPPFIENGGYWSNPDDYTLIGVAPDPNEYYIPDTVTKLPLAEVKTRQLAIHAKYQMRSHPEDKHMTNSELETMIDNWWTGVQ